MADQFEIVDAHHHLWDLGSGEYKWVADRHPHRYGDLAPVARNYLPADYHADTAPLRVIASVHVEAARTFGDPLPETKWLARVREDRYPAVCVTRAFLDSENVAEVLAAQASYPFVRGVRAWPKVAWTQADYVRGAPGSMDDKRWRDGYALLERHNMSFDLLAPWWHLAEAADLARDFPRTTMIINHMAYPPESRDPATLAAWRKAIEHVAREPNVTLKISGIAIGKRPWNKEDYASIIRDAVRIMGAERCLFGSNFPLDRLVVSFATMVSDYRSAVADLPAEAQRKLFRDNALRVYRI